MLTTLGMRGWKSSSEVTKVIIDVAIVLFFLGRPHRAQTNNIFSRIFNTALNNSLSLFWQV
jgi:hypothetical protein